MPRIIFGEVFGVDWARMLRNAARYSGKRAGDRETAGYPWLGDAPVGPYFRGVGTQAGPPVCREIADKGSSKIYGVYENACKDTNNLPKPA